MWVHVWRQTEYICSRIDQMAFWVIFLMGRIKHQNERIMQYILSNRVVYYIVYYNYSIYVYKSAHGNKSKHKATFIIIIVFIFQKNNENDVQTAYNNVYKVSVCIYLLITFI